MNDPAILFVNPKAISQEDKDTLRAAGIIVVEVNDVRNVRFMRPSAEIPATEMLMAAAEAIPPSEYSTKAFGKAICAAIQAQKGKAT